MEALTSMKTEVSPALGATGSLNNFLEVTTPDNFCGSRNIVVKAESLLRIYDGNAVAPLRGQDQWLDDLVGRVVCDCLSTSLCFKRVFSITE